MMLAADVYDVSPGSSAVTVLHENGADPWVVDFGAPEHEEGGLERNLADHVVAVSDAVDRVREATGRDVHLGGYSQGGMFCYQAAAYRRGEGIDSVVAFGSPVDTRVALPLGISEEVAESAAGILAGVFGRTAVPAWMSRTGFRLLDPVKSLRQQVDFILQLHDREALLPRERQRRFLMGEGWVAWPGPAVADFMRQFIAHNRMLQGGFVIEDRTVTLADIDRPVLTVVGTVDEIAPAAGVRAITRAAPRAEVYELALPAGHFGLVVGSAATKTTWPAVAAWTRWRSAEGELPEIVRRVDADEQEFDSPGVGTRLGVGLELAAGVGGGFARSLAGAASRAIGGARVLAEEVTGQLPRLARLGRLEPHTRVSLGLLLDEQAGRTPEADFFLFEDRAYSHEAAKNRIDNVVRGLVSLGVRQGEHVGVLMSTRPSGLSVVAALNRLGAVAVLMRPDGPVAREAELGQVTRIVADPELAARALEAGAPEVLVLGGGGEERDLGGGVIDMERIDPDQVELPAWYRPNPGRASDLAFILFTGEGERTRANRLTNGRWALSAFATASAAALSDDDTVYAVTPIYHPSGLLMSIGGAIAGGARVAIARDFDPATFWAEVRRYGITVASYTWTMLRRDRDRARGPGRAPPPGSAVHRRRDAARPLAPGLAPVLPRHRARVLRLDRGRGDPRQRQRRQARLQGPAAARQRRGPPRRLRRRGGPPARAPGRVRDRVRARRGRDAADPPARRRLDQREPAAGRVRARRRLAFDRRPVPRRRGRRPVAGRPRRGADPHRARPRRRLPDPRRARRPRRDRPRRRLRGSGRGARASSSRWPRSPCAAAASSTASRWPRRSRSSTRPSGPTSSTSSTRSRSPPGTGRAPPSCAPRGSRTATRSGAARATRTCAREPVAA